MVRVNTLFQMEAYTKVGLEMVKDMVMGPINGRMVKNTLETGSMVSVMGMFPLVSAPNVPGPKCFLLGSATDRK